MTIDLIVAIVDTLNDLIEISEDGVQANHDQIKCLRDIDKAA